MKTSQFYFNGNREEVEIWFEESGNNSFDYWEKLNGISYTLSRKQYFVRVNKHALLTHT